ncbi:pilus assembly protein TadG-related protein [Streptomyces sp. NPDC051219]|uniref:pilus assembly protein TadG-related protein n=1 Tax=Streptomyces sp. NPDC051219 TaxID=3155283 RepID=UPI00343A9D13
MPPRFRGDQGQAFPIYIMMVAGLLFLALAFFAVGQASATRNGAQGAADAAALAAAQEARNNLLPGFDLELLDPEGWQDLLHGGGFDLAGSCGRAADLAAANDSTITDCPPPTLTNEFTIEIESNYTVGNSVIPGTEVRRATALATAVIEPRCGLVTPAAPGNERPPGADEDGEEPVPVEFTCDGGEMVEFDPLHPTPWLDLGKLLFSVHLVD